MTRPKHHHQHHPARAIGERLGELAPLPLGQMLGCQLLASQV